MMYIYSILQLCIDGFFVIPVMFFSSRSLIHQVGFVQQDGAGKGDLRAGRALRDVPLGFIQLLQAVQGIHQRHHVVHHEVALHL